MEKLSFFRDEDIELPNSLGHLTSHQIATKLIPDGEGRFVTVLAASDEQFQKFVLTHAVLANRLDSIVLADPIEAWSFEARCKTINLSRDYGVDLFAES